MPSRRAPCVSSRRVNACARFSGPTAVEVNHLGGAGWLGLRTLRAVTGGSAAARAAPHRPLRRFRGGAQVQRRGVVRTEARRPGDHAQVGSEVGEGAGAVIRSSPSASPRPPGPRATSTGSLQVRTGSPWRAAAARRSTVKLPVYRSWFVGGTWKERPAGGGGLVAPPSRPPRRLPGDRHAGHQAAGEPAGERARQRRRH
jgi:hypothetical protein